MKKSGENFELSATDLVGFLNCRHLTGLDRAVVEGTLEKPAHWNPLLEILWERGSVHEQSYVEHLENSGLSIVRIEGVDVSSDAVDETRKAMAQGAEVIVQGALTQDGWIGRADILRRVKVPSSLGAWSYEVLDTKLARETKAGTILQLCLYSELLAEVQGLLPEHMYVVAPWADFEPQQYRVTDFAAFYRQAKRTVREVLLKDQADDTYPDPKSHCDICRWGSSCDKRRRDDDHLCLVAGISKLQINELNQQGIATVQNLAEMPVPLTWKPERGSSQACPSSKCLGQLSV